jgi:hypothetical protein
MAISRTDLKFYESQRMRDTADGGGAMSPNEVVDGELNNVFDDVSSEDRVSGRVSIRKVFPGVFSDNTDRFYGAGVMIIEPAADPAVDVLMTRREFYDDERGDIVDRIQSYLTAGATQPWRLWNDHLTGTAALTLYSVEGARNPDLGDTWFLEDSDGVQATEAVKIQSIVSRTTQTFIDSNFNPFQRDVLVVELSRPLQSDWEGSEVQRSTVSTPPTVLRSSTPASGARYYSTKKLLENISQGDLTVKVDNPYRRIVPTTSAEQPLTDERATLSGVSYQQVGDTDAITVSDSQSYSAGETKSWFIGGTILPGSISISGTITATDPGTGTLSITGTGTTATVDYETGEISITRNSGGSVSLTITATPAAAVQDSTLTVQVPVTAQTRQLNYVRTLRPLPAPGTVSVDYRALGNWYRLTDNGAGSLSGESSGQGGGSVNYGTGTVTATLAALPDVGTTIIFSWGNPVIVSNESGEQQPSPPQIRFTVTPAPIKPGTLEITYDSDGSTITHTTDADGYVIDAATDQIGRYVPHTGEVAFIPKASEWPDSDAVINYSYDKSNAQQEQFQPTPSGGSDTVTFTLATPPEPGSVKLKWPVEAEVYGRTRVFEVDVIDDGQGGLLYPDGNAVTGATINYGTGEISMPAAYEVSP